MKRPSKEHFSDMCLTSLPPQYISKEEQYIKALEDYCDYLERRCKKFKNISISHDDIDRWNQILNAGPYNDK